MKKTLTNLKHFARILANVILSIGLFAVFSEGDSFIPNFIGLACFAGLILINKNNSYGCA